MSKDRGPLEHVAREVSTPALGLSDFGSEDAIGGHLNIIYLKGRECLKYQNLICLPLQKTLPSLLALGTDLLGLL